MKGTGLLSGALSPLLMLMTDRRLLEAEWREPRHVVAQMIVPAALGGDAGPLGALLLAG